MQKQIVVNTIVFQELIHLGVQQWELFESIKNLGVSKVEVRREYIENFDNEIPRMAEQAIKHNLELLYSVPALLFTAGELNKTDLCGYLRESEKLGATMVKFTVGDFNPARPEQLRELDELVRGRKVLVTVENDQTLLSGKVAALQSFLEVCQMNQISLYCTFDIGNWCWVGEDPVQNAARLAPYVKYIHLKDVDCTNGKPVAKALDEGQLDWRSLLKLLPQALPVGLEFPAGKTALDVLNLTIAKLTTVR